MLIIITPDNKTIADHNIVLCADTASQAAITKIRASVVTINQHIASFKQVTKTDDSDEGESTEGNEVVKYYDGSTLKKILTIYFGETGKLVEEYYFDKNTLIFFYSVEYRYGIPLNATKHPEKIKSIPKTEKRYYFSGNVIIKALTKPVAITSVAGMQKQAILTLKEAKKISAL